MKKWLIGGIVAVALIWAGVTALVSQKSEAAFNRVLERAQQQLPLSELTLTKTQYKKGFLSSIATSTLSEREQNAPVIAFRHVIYHGPIMWTPSGIRFGSSYILTTIDEASLDDEQRQALESAFNGAIPLTIGVLVTDGQTVAVEMEVAPFKLDADGAAGVSLVSAGMQSRFEAETHRPTPSGDFALGRMAFDLGEQGSLEIAAVSGSFSIDERYKTLALSGVSEFTVPAISFTGPQGEWTLKDLSLQTRQTHNGGTYTGELGVAAQSMALVLHHPEVTVPPTALNYELQVSGVDVAALKRVADAQERMNQNQQQLLAQQSQTGEATEAVAEQFAEATQRYLEALVDSVHTGVQLTTQLQLVEKTDADAQATLALAYDDTRPLTALVTLGDLLSAFNGKFTLDLDAQLQNNPLVGEWIEMGTMMGLIQPDAERLKFSAALENGATKVNGQPFPLLDMLGPLASQPLTL